MVCSRCNGTEFRLSGFRFGDVEHLAVLQYPVRCRHCHHRAYGNFLLALFLYQVRRQHFDGRDHV
jgi:hypothetical protein